MSTTSRRMPRQRTNPDVRRRSAVYGIPCLPVDANGRILHGQPVIVGYIGKSVQTVKEREEQHRFEQPFGDTIVGGSWTIEEGYWTAAELDAKEQYYIRHGVALVPGQKPQRPVYNYEFNTDNPGRIEIFRAEDHRRLREPGWVRPPKGARIPQQRGRMPRRKQPAPSWLDRWWARNRLRITGWATVWVALLVAAWWAGADTWAGWDEPRNAAITATTILAIAAAVALHKKRSKPRRRGRTTRKRRR